MITTVYKHLAKNQNIDIKMRLFLIVIFFLRFLCTPGLSQLNPSYILFEDTNGNIYYEDRFERTLLKPLLNNQIKLFLYTRTNPQSGCEIFLNSFKELQNCQFYDPTKENYFITHGWKSSYMSESSVVIKDAVLAKVDINVFVVDWGNIAKYKYLSCYLAVQDIGEVIARFINDMITSLKLSPKMFMLVGHSLGAHIAGCTGAAVKGSVKYIVGLDPAGPLFTTYDKKNLLDTGDAQFVQVIHTSITFFGFAQSIGHADYYPNNGKNQPGCLEMIGGCSHGRSYMYFAESIRSGGFSAVHCESYDKFKNGGCVDQRRSYVGSLDLDTSAQGDYYLDTASQTPFSLK